MTSPRPNNESAPRIMPQEAQTRMPALVSGIGLLVIGLVWLVLFAVHILHGSSWQALWWEPVSGLAFLLLGAVRLRRVLRSQAGRN